MLGKKAYTLAEFMVASFIVVILFTSTLGVYVMIRAFSSSSIAEENLQRDINGVMSQIVRGMKENGGFYGLRSAVSVTSLSLAKIDYKGTDGNVREYNLSNGALIYTSPTASPKVQTIYSAPANSTITLQFWWASTDQETVGMYLSVTQRVADRPISGSVSTYVNLRNMQKS